MDPRNYRVLTLVGATGVLVVTLVVSSVHLYQVSVTAGAGWLAFLTPVAVDALGMTAAVSLWSARTNGEPVSVSAVIALVLSLSASIAGNVLYPFLGSLSVDFIPVLSAIVAVYPALALAVSVELVLSAVRHKDLPTSGSRVLDHKPDTRAAETVTESLTSAEVVADPMVKLRQALEENPSATSADLAPIVGRSASWVRSKRSELVASNG